MSRRLLSTVLVLVLLLQGVTTQVRAEVLPDAQAQHHCDGHETSGMDCPCCDEETMLNGGCETLCSMMAVLPTTSLDVPRTNATNSHRRIAIGAPSPAYVPLNPPPIS
jgi:hypothetical protein